MFGQCWNMARQHFIYLHLLPYVCSYVYYFCFCMNIQNVCIHMWEKALSFVILSMIMYTTILFLYVVTVFVVENHSCIYEVVYFCYCDI